jgi:hypothetical protein
VLRCLTVRVSHEHGDAANEAEADHDILYCSFPSSPLAAGLCLLRPEGAA